MNQLTPAPRWITDHPIAHRGYHDLAEGRPENSLAAILAAADAGFSTECDLQMSSTGEPMVFHDPTLDRMTGDSGKVWQMTPQQLAEMHLLGTDQVIDSLATILERIDGRVPIILELKGNLDHDAGLVAGVAQCLRSYTGQVAVMSFNHWLCDQFSQLMPHIARGLTAQGDDESYEGHIAAMRAYDLQFVSYKVQDVDCRFVREMRALGLPVITWTVRDEQGQKRTNKYADQMTFEGFDPRERPNG
ncbi:MAG: glycerophosphodiester phosphodiesterase family protein [Rhizobiaceae bacterium]